MDPITWLERIRDAVENPRVRYAVLAATAAVVLGVVVLLTTGGDDKAADVSAGPRRTTTTERSRSVFGSTETTDTLDELVDPDLPEVTTSTARAGAATTTTTRRSTGAVSTTSTPPTSVVATTTVVPTSSTTAAPDSDADRVAKALLLLTDLPDTFAEADEESGAGMELSIGYGCLYDGTTADDTKATTNELGPPFVETNGDRVATSSAQIFSPVDAGETTKAIDRVSASAFGDCLRDTFEFSGLAPDGAEITASKTTDDTLGVDNVRWRVQISDDGTTIFHDFLYLREGRLLSQLLFSDQSPASPATWRIAATAAVAGRMNG